MSRREPSITLKSVDDTLVASIRFHGEYEEVPLYFAKLHEQVEPYINGSAMCIYRGRDPKGGYHLEVCYPVSQHVEAGEVKSWVLEGGHMAIGTRRGPCDSSEAIWGQFFTDIGGVEITNDPPIRMVFLEGDEREDVSKEHAVEIQAPLLLPVWLSRLAEGLTRFAGETVERSVMAGSEGLPPDCEPSERAEWLGGAMGRLDAAIADEETRSNILTGCSHRFPDWRIQEMRATYERLGNIDELLVVMRMDQSVNGQSWYESPVRLGNTIYVTKDPVNQQAYLQTTDKTEKRAHYCHCGLVRAAILAQEPISPTHCHCGAGWYTQLWGGILGRPVRVEVLQSILKGDPCCTFAIHLPEDTV